MAGSSPRVARTATCGSLPNGEPNEYPDKFFYQGEEKVSNYFIVIKNFHPVIMLFHSFCLA
ncbi:hypothetical protein P378_02305 [Desulforamulus profundi]|uniref:Uncharacterized protein n=1 Tax=Desulforamulus profundi TaxID=1383067 RepID=A0A2C6MEB2_9FIRM|nr:hypothetical protein P378_02305 [Desulforamulus profundi]